MADLYLVRHGATEWSLSGRHTGSTDLRLLPEREEAARSLAPLFAGLDLDLGRTSPMHRARRTGALSRFPEPEFVEDLAEWGYVVFEGVTADTIRETDPGWTFWHGDVPN